MKQGDPDYWLKRSKRGKPKKLKSPKHLWDLACEYFKSVDDNPFKKNDFIKGGEFAGVIVKLDQMKPYTWVGLENYLFEKDIIADLNDYELNTDRNYDEYQPVIRAIKKVIWEQSYSGAASNVFNANIIARQLGLIDQSLSKVEMSGAVDYSKMSPELLEELARNANAGKAEK